MNKKQSLLIGIALVLLFLPPTTPLLQLRKINCTSQIALVEKAAEIFVVVGCDARSGVAPEV